LNAIHAIKVVAISTPACTLSSSCNREKQLKLYNLQKDVNSLAVKKSAALCKMASMKKVVKYRWRPRNGCDGRSVTKILITAIQMNCVASSQLH